MFHGLAMGIAHTRSFSNTSQMSRERLPYYTGIWSKMNGCASSMAIESCVRILSAYGLAMADYVADYVADYG